MLAEPPRRIGRPPATVDGRTVPERLVGAAQELFAERGFESTSVQDVVAAAGVTKGAMYHYFDSKDDLLAEIYGRVLRLQTEQLEAVARNGEAVEVRVHTAAADVVVSTLENLQSTTVFFRSLHLLSQDKQDDVRAERRRYHDTFRAMIREGQRNGTFRDDIAADLVVDFFFGSVHHLPMWWGSHRDLTPAQVGNSFATLLLGSLSPS